MFAGCQKGRATMGQTRSMIFSIQQLAWLKWRRATIIQRFGGICQVEGCQSHVKIEFHHLYGWGGEPLATISPSKRLLIYELGLQDGTVKLHCKYHHKLTFNYAGRARLYKKFQSVQTNVPF